MRSVTQVVLLVAFCVGTTAYSQDVNIRVDTSAAIAPFKQVYGYFGYDEPNFTYAENGRKLVGELAATSKNPVYIRTHFMLGTGDAKGELKFGSTNAYTVGASGKPVYDWTVTDRIIDTYLKAGAKPFVEIGFMPQALSSKPDPYHVPWIPGAKNEHYSAGWSYPPADYSKWEELVFQWVRHTVEKYGRSEVATWYWEVWNEPDISYWHGTPEEYDELYDYAAHGVKRALPDAKIGGPATTGPANQHAGEYLRQFLEHCARGKNFATGSVGSPLDFVTFHAKGHPAVVDGHVRMGISNNASDVARGFEILQSFERFRKLPVILSESDPEGCAACSARVYPQNSYRNGTLYPSYTALMLKTILDLAAHNRSNIEGILTWAFEFENQPYFEGFRSLATNGIDKPILNLFRMDGLMHGDRVRVESTGSLPLDTIVHSGVRDAADIDAIAVKSERQISVLVWNYHDVDAKAPDANVTLDLASLPRTTTRARLDHYRIDEHHSNAWTLWKELGSPQIPSPEQRSALESAGQLQLLESPRWIDAVSGNVRLSFALPRQGVSLIQLTW